MADKNLHDIKIDETEKKKKTPLKNILTLLALLFIILVISVVITKLILNTGDSESMENNLSTLEASAKTEESGNINGATIAGAAALAGAAGTLAVTANSSSDSAKNTLNTATDKAKDAVNNVANGTKDTTHNVANDVKDTADNVANSEKDTVHNVVKKDVHGSKTKVTLRDHQPVKSTKKASTSSHTTSHSSTTSSHSTKRASTQRTTSSSRTAHGKNVSKLSKGFYIKVGTFRNINGAVQKVKKTGLDYKLVKTKEGLTRIYLGRFVSRKSAQAHLRKAKALVNSGSFIYEVK